ncbi:HAMP domain-containing sensor histidine kinase [Streptomyces sp. SPB162]|uniref:HAMP domain-containing sensor histidine kinase n=1 Tax=Streptomyces sp. SPB162 TaxID=2940560 RepID=UPI00240629FF|nr:HAMP domain-containing sensor histidine kinase [Streptomyces sp. SPB162]MDF9814713.1 two-component system sensor histidine kinase MprB [Streptomyces sp. SPB162]
MKRLPLRSRLAILTAAAVAVAVAAVALSCWLITKQQLTNQLDTTLRSAKVDINDLRRLARDCTSPSPSEGVVQPTPYTTQIVYGDGQTCTYPGKAKLTVHESDLAVMKGTQRYAVHNTTTADSSQTDMRVVTRSLEGPPGTTTGIAVSIAQPLSTIDDPLSTLAWVLLAVAGIGVVGAGGAGLLIARAGLKPVDRLTETVEHVARTEDLSVRIPVEGEDEIARLSESFNAMTAALASSRDRQQQLIADAGHELRTPLTSLRTNIELLERSEAAGRPIPPADRKALLASVKAQMTELAALIGDLQELSRPDAAPTLQVVALHEVAEAALERARLRGPDLTIRADLAPWYVRAEPAALERAVVNLLDNAVKFSPPAGSVEVRLEHGVLMVRDHGPGIPEDELPHVFERFWRSPSARSLPGSGLGLSIVARTVQQSGGEVSLRPAGGGGTVATVRLPGAPTAPPAVAARAET